MTNQRKNLQYETPNPNGTSNNSNADSSGNAASRAKDSLCYCAVSHKLLWPPIVIDRLGNLYCKAALLEFLVAARRGEVDPVAQQRLAHIRKLKDIRDVVLAGGDAIDPHHQPTSVSEVLSLIKCPVTSKTAEACGKAFVVWWECGHATTRSDESQRCPFPGCGEGRTHISLHQTESEKQALQQQLLNKKRSRKEDEEM